MKRSSKIGVLLLLLFATTVVFSQRRPVRDKIKTLKVAFITERLDLSSSEAQRFWPVYNEHEANIEAIKRRERTEIRARLMDFDMLSEKEAQQLLDDLLALENQKHEMNIAFIRKMSSVISAKRTFRLIKAEEDFKKRLLKEMQERKRGQ